MRCARLEKVMRGDARGNLPTRGKLLAENLALIIWSSFVRRDLLISIAVALASAAICRTARAAEPSTLVEDPRPNAALAACASGDVAKGISILGTLYAETRNPSYVFNQARCYQKNGQLDQARSSFAEYLRIGTNEPPEDVKRAEGFIKEIDEAIAQQRASAPTPMLVTPVSPAEEGRSRTLRVASIVLAGVAVAAIATGVYLSLKVQSIEDDLNREFAGQEYVTDFARLQQQLADGKSYETWQWVGYGVGVAALAGAATTFILSTRAAGSPEHAALGVAPALSPHGVGGLVRMRF
jgi:hypothetical protein